MRSRFHVRPRRRSLYSKIVASVAIVGMLSLTWQEAVAGMRPDAVAAAPPAEGADDARGVVGRLVPTAVTWQRGGAQGGDRSVAVLFDGDQATSFRTEGEAVLRVGLAGLHPVRGIGVYGRADGELSVFTVDRKGGTTPVAGLQGIDLGALPLRWNRFWAEKSPATDALVLKWRPRGGATAVAAPLRELEILGLGSDSAAPSRAALADRLLSGTPADAIEAWSETEGLNVSGVELGEDGTAAFPVSFPVDPRLIERAFLMYELGGLPHWSAPLRQVNGHSMQGGFHAEVGAGSGLQVEEISPEWLFRGDNEIRFRPVDDDFTGYRVRRLRLVAFARGSETAASAAAPAIARGRQPTGEAAAVLAALSDGNPETGIEAAGGPIAVTLPLAAGAQPASLGLSLRERASGRLWAATIGADGEVIGRAAEIDAGTLAPGWNAVPLDKLPTGQGVRLTWEAGNDGRGAISELRLVASPAADGAAGRRLAVTYPLHGECVDHQAYVRGFVTGAELDRLRPRLSLGEDAPDGAIAADGAFAVVVEEPAAARGRRWTVPVRARFADGSELAADVAVEACGDRPLAVRPPPVAGPPPLIEDEDAPFAKMIAAREGGVVDMGGVRLEIPAGALARDTRVTVRPLLEEQVQPTDELMTNVTVDGRAFRLAPHNLQFSKPVRLSIPYDSDRVPDGTPREELGVFYYDEGMASWQQLPTVPSRGRGVLVAETTHFTDFIASTIARPEQQAPVMSSPKMVADLKVGDPAASTTLIKPPTASNDGAAHLSYPIEVPPGRNGMQPSLNLQYSSEGPNGLLGVGWSLPISNITLDTRFGTARHEEGTIESERYLLDGEELVPADGGTLRTKDRPFKRRVEGKFDKIIRKGTYNGTSWEVTDKNGVLYEFGPSITGEATRIQVPDGNGDTNIVHWPLVRVTDPFGNMVKYTYRLNQGGDTGDWPSGRNQWNELLLDNITYTHSPARPPAFKIIAEYGGRPDPSSSARLGAEVRTNSLLTGLRIQAMNNSSVLEDYRRYVFQYTTGEFGKSLLAAVSVESNGTFFYQHKFSYKQLPRDAEGRLVFGASAPWSTTSLPSGVALGKGTGTASGFNGFGGLGPPTCYPHAGFGMGGGLDTDAKNEVLADVNGDGLPDLVRNGTSYFNAFDTSGGVPNRNRGQFTARTTSLGNIEETASSSRTLGGGLHFVGEMGINGNWTDARSVQGKGLVDMNGDGLVDHFYGDSVRCNGNEQAVPCPGVTKVFPFSALTPWSGANAASYPASPDQDPNNVGGSTFPTQIFARWRAPFDGTIRIDAPVARTFTINPSDPDAPPAAPVTTSLHIRTFDPQVSSVVEKLAWAYRFENNDTSSCHPTAFNGPPVVDTGCNTGFISTGFSHTVRAGDEYYFIVGSPAGNARNAVWWDPTITYTDAPCPNPSDPRTCTTFQTEPYGSYINRFSVSGDLRMGGQAAIPWVTASADTRPNGSLYVTPTTVKLNGVITKQVTPDDVRFQVVKMSAGVRTVVWPSNGIPMQMNADQATSFSFDANNVVIPVKGQWVPHFVDDRGFPRLEYRLEADQLIFQVLTDSPVDPKQISWKPTVSYQSFCYPDPNDQQARFLSTGAMPDPVSVSHICTSTPASVIGGSVTQEVEVQYPAFRYQPLTPAASFPGRPQAFYLFNDNANHTFSVIGGLRVTPGAGVDPSWTSSVDRGQVVVLLQSRNRLIKKVVHQIGTDPSVRIVPFEIADVAINGAEPIYLTVLVTGNHGVLWIPTIAPQGLPLRQDLVPTVRYLTDPPLPGKAAGYPFQWSEREWLAGGYHQWTYGVYNGNYEFDTQGIRIPLSYQGESQPNTFFPAVPSTAGIPNPPPELPGTFAPYAPIWRGKASDDYISPQGVFHASYFGSGSGPAWPPGAVFRRSSTHSGGGGLNAGVSLESTFGSTDGEVDVMDLNGDRVPDLVGMDRVNFGRLYIDGVMGYGPITVFPMASLMGGSLRNTVNRSSRWGIGLGSISSQMSDQPDPKGGTKALKSSAPSFGIGYGTSRTAVDLIDINGDGLPDQVSKPAGNDVVWVQLGNGYGVYNFFQSEPQPWSMPALSGDISQSPTSYFESYLFEDEDGLRVQDNASNSLEVNIMNIGGGVAFQASRSMVDMIDLNGDGLPDRVMKVPPRFVIGLPPLTGIVPPGSSPMRVEWNTGMGFLPPETIVMPPWGPDIENSILTGVGLGSNDALSFTTGRTASVSAGAVIPIPIFPFVCIMIEFGVKADLPGGLNAQNTQMTFQDMNGDGRPDQIFKKDELGIGGGDNLIHVKLNPIDNANYLTRVDGPLGGGFSIEYTRAGNEVDRTNNRRLDMPDNHYVMSAVTVQPGAKTPAPASQPLWNADPDVRTEFAYSEGFYSRADREFLGFARVVTNHVGPADRLVVQETYDTQDIYHKGLLLKRVSRKRASGVTVPDDSLPVFEVEEHVYHPARTIQPAPHPVFEPRDIRFVPEQVRRFRSYEGSGTNPDSATVTREEVRDFENTYGDIISLQDNGDTAVSTDNVSYTIGYDRDTTRYIMRANSVTARNSANAVVAQRTATFDRGRILTTTDLLVGGRRPSDGVTYNGAAATNPTPNPVWTFTYDTLGVLRSVTDPNNYLISVNSLDSVTASYPRNMSDSLGLTWSTEFDRRTAQPTKSVDVNAVLFERTYDVHGRPIGAFTTVPGGSAVQRLSVSYQPAGAPPQVNDQPARALVTYFNNETAETLSLADGWGRVIQTKKKASVDTGTGTATAGLIVSGRVAYDLRGRLVSQGQPSFTAGQTVQSLPTFQAQTSVNPTSFSYDVLGRRTAVNHPAGRPPSTSVFDLLTLTTNVGGTAVTALRKRQTDTDSNGKFVRTFRDARGNVIAVQQRNTVGTATTPTTLTTEYQYDALSRLLTARDAKANNTNVVWDTLSRMTSLTNPENGQTRYDYDLNGNLGRRQTAKGSTSNLIKYLYDFNRLRLIDYPTSPDVTLTYYVAGDVPAGMIGRLKRRVDEAGMEDFQYDAFGNLTQTTWTPTPVSGTPPPSTVITTGYNYDFMGVLRSLTVPGETINYAYNSQGLPMSVSGVRSGGVNQQYATSILYSQFGQRTKMALSNGVTTTYGYDAATRRLSTINTDGPGGQQIQRMTYGYDFVGNVTGFANMVPVPSSSATPIVPGRLIANQPLAGQPSAFVYDDLYQLKSAIATYTGPNSGGGRVLRVNMVYDEVGNITRKNQSHTNASAGGQPVTVSGTTYDSTYTYATAGKPRAPSRIASLQANGSTLTEGLSYDPNGSEIEVRNQSTSAVTRTLTWNEEDRLKSVMSSSPSATLSFLYRSDGQRAIKRLGATSPTTTNYANQFYVDRVGSQVTRHIMLGSERIASVIIPNGQSARNVYYHTDHLKSSSYVTTQSGALNQHNEYFPSGETWLEEVKTGTGLPPRVPYLFNAKELDESGLYYMDARYYDPRHSMWMSTDPALRSYVAGKPNGGLRNPNNLNLYSYAYNSPVTLRDPTGLAPYVDGEGRTIHPLSDFPATKSKLPKGATGFTDAGAPIYPVESLQKQKLPKGAKGSLVIEEVRPEPLPTNATYTLSENIILGNAHSEKRRNQRFPHLVEHGLGIPTNVLHILEAAGVHKVGKLAVGKAAKGAGVASAVMHTIELGLAIRDDDEEDVEKYSFLLVGDALGIFGGRRGAAAGAVIHISVEGALMYNHSKWPEDDGGE